MHRDASSIDRNLLRLARESGVPVSNLLENEVDKDNDVEAEENKIGCWNARNLLAKKKEKEKEKENLATLIQTLLQVLHHKNIDSPALRVLAEKNDLGYLLETMVSKFENEGSGLPTLENRISSIKKNEEDCAMRRVWEWEGFKKTLYDMHGEIEGWLERERIDGVAKMGEEIVRSEGLEEGVEGESRSEKAQSLKLEIKAMREVAERLVETTAAALSRGATRIVRSGDDVKDGATEVESSKQDENESAETKRNGNDEKLDEKVVDKISADDICGVSPFDLHVPKE